MDRRSIVKSAGLAGVLAAGVAPAVHAQAAVRWRLASSFPRSLDTIFGSAEKLSQTVKALSGGKFEISVHPAGELMPAFGVVDALQGDNIDMAQTAAYYFTGKDPVFAFSCAVPFGLTARQNTAWKQHGNGGKLLDEFFAQYKAGALDIHAYVAFATEPLRERGPEAAAAAHALMESSTHVGKIMLDWTA